MTLGSRAIVLDGQNILLVKLTYQSGWHLPGGAVEKGESMLDAMKRELLEECSIKAHETELFGLYFNQYQGKNDHVSVYTVSSFSGTLRPDPKEISEAIFFPLSNLPVELSPGTKRRLLELTGGQAKSSVW